MRRFACAALVLLCPLGESLRAQTVAIGLKAGVTAAHFTSNDLNYYGTRRAVTAAGDVTLQIGPVFGLRLEAMLVERGSVGGIDMRLRYLEFPILARLAAPATFLGVRPAVLLGVASAREIGCHLVVWEVGGIPEDPTPASPRELDCIEWRQTGLDFSAVAGVELQRTLPHGQLSIELRYSRGLRDLASAYACCRLQSRTWALLVGYGLALLR